MVNMLCHQNNSPICLGSRLEWKPAPYICKRPRPIDSKDFRWRILLYLVVIIVCPILFDEVRVIKWNEMLVVAVNRTVALIKCKIPEFNTEIKVQYHCHTQTKKWKLVYKNDNFTCRM